MIAYLKWGDHLSARLIVTVAFCALLAACDERQPAEKADDMQERMKQDTALIADPERAEVELERRLMTALSVDGDLLLVKDKFAEVYILPATTAWTLQCGISGMSIVFGNSVTGAADNVSNDVDVNLSLGTFTQKDCLALGPRVGKRLQSMLARRDQSTISNGPGR